MTPNLSFLTRSFDSFNDRIFNSELPVPRMALTRARTFRGKLIYRMRSRLPQRHYDYEMRFSTGFDLPENEWEDVVIHEMIHLYIVSKGMNDSSSHGPVFRRLMNDINRRHGRHIVVSTRATEAQLDADRRIRGHFLCIAKFSDGRLGVAPVAKSRIFTLWDEFPRIPNVISVKWVGSTDPWFNRFPRAMKVKLYLTTEAELTEHLKGAVPLERQGAYIRPVNGHYHSRDLLP